MSSVFVTGGNRGIGFELVKQYASVEGNTVFTTSIDVELSVELNKLAKELGNIKVFILDVNTQDNIDALEKELPEFLNDGIDIFIANAGIGNSFYPILKAPRKVYEDHYNINVLGTIGVTKIIYPYLLKKKTRKIIILSSIAAQITDFNKSSVSAYGISKTSLNYTAKALSFELAEEGFIVIPINPGIVLTDMFQIGYDLAPEPAKKFYLSIAITTEVSVNGIIKVVSGLTKEDSGKFFHYLGNELTY